MSEQIEEGAIKIIEVMGVSTKSFENAVEQAVAKASKSIKGITGVEVLKHSARVNESGISQYRVNCKLAFVVK